MKDIENEYPIVLCTAETVSEYKELMKLKEELGCPLEVIVKLRKTNYIYRDDGLVFGFISINFNDEDKLILYNDDEYNMFTRNVRKAHSFRCGMNSTNNV